LRPGDKVILYTDGLEVAYAPERFADDPVAYQRAIFDRMVRLSAGEVVEQVRCEMDAEAGSLHPRDDLTLVAMQLASA
jgi:hypothetical protein